MDRDSNLGRRAWVLLGLGVFLVISITWYATRPNSYALPTASLSYSPAVTNPEVLQDWLPLSVYQFTLARIDDYLKSNGMLADYLTTSTTVDTSNGTYDFDVTVLPQRQTLHVSVKVTNFAPIISSAVAINGQLQNPVVLSPSQHYPGTPQFTGFDSLINDGITASQGDELQQAFTSFAPSASAITINTNSIVPSTIDPNNPSSTNTYTFLVNIDNTGYNARLNCTGLTQIELILTSVTSHKQVFDSGILGQS